MLASAAFLYRNHDRQGQIVTLGLDLQGGSHYALELDDSRARLAPSERADAVERALKVVRMRVDELGTTEPVVQKAGDDRIIVELPGLKDQSRAKEVLQKTAFLEFQIVRPLTELQAVLPRMDAAVNRAFPDAGKATAATPAAANPVGGILQNAPKADSAGGDSTKRDSATLASATTTPATPNAATGTPLSSKLNPGQPGALAVRTADTAQVAKWLRSPEVQRALPRGTTLLWGVPEAEDNPEIRTLWFVENSAIMTGESLETAQAQGDQFGRPIVAFQLGRAAGRSFEKATGAHINQQMAIVLDDRVYTAPSIRSQIGARGQIDMGSAKLEDASELALVLRAGALPVPLRIVEERSVGPSLGADSINKGIVAGIVGIAAVVLIMVGVYKRSGFLSVIALAIYVLLTLGMLAALDATLTFPGIAGLILSVGMAVDANVLIFERIREELDAGRNVKTAINEGFHHALRAIIDSAVTTLITSAILFYTGTGPIRGFAVTLALGVVASMFTAIFTTRTLMMLDLGRQSAGTQKLSI
ncbi:MAG TPA: protein translocase subunit SecD [Longimicrobium sp.]